MRPMKSNDTTALDRPPILRFLILFAMLLSAALGVAAVASSADSGNNAAAAPADPQRTETAVTAPAPR